MNGDFSRFSHKRVKHYSRVLRQQGRVDVDADHNEQAEIQQHLDRSTRRDVIGHSGYPIKNGAFKLTPTPDGQDLFISPGRFYVDGLLVEVDTTWLPCTPLAAPSPIVDVAAEDPDGRPFATGQWVELRTKNGATRTFRVAGVGPGPTRLQLQVAAVADLTPFRAVGAEPRLRRLPTVRSQPDVPGTIALAPAPGTTLGLYLEVFERHVTEVEDVEVKDKAIGGPDTATRVKTVWRVLPTPAGNAIYCKDDIPNWPPAPSRGRLSTSVTPTVQTDDDCTMPPQAGYRGMENRLYRVEIHGGGNVGAATFKWSRDNASVTYAITGFFPTDPTKVKLRRLGRDRMVALQQDDWVELVSDAEELAGTPGTMVQVHRVNLADDTVTLKQAVAAVAPHLRPKLRRWDGKTNVATTAAGPIELEAGVRISFSGEAFRTRDHWAFAARVADRSVELLHAASPLGEHRRYAKLGLLTNQAGTWKVKDCRKAFKPLTDLGDCSCTVTVGDGVSSHGDFTDLQEAIDSVGPLSKVCILPGTHRLPATVVIEDREQLTIEGSGRASRIVAPPGKTAIEVQGSDHIRFEALHIESVGPHPVVAIWKSKRITLRHSTLTNTIPGSLRVDPPIPHPDPDRDQLEADPDAPPSAPQVQVLALDTIECDPNGVACFASDSRHIRIEDCLLVGAPAASLQGSNLHLMRSRLGGGGLWIRENSEQVVVRGNQIGSGRGNGITLGGLTYSDGWPTRNGVSAVDIRGNEIFQMDGSGIAPPAALARTNPHPDTGGDATSEDNAKLREGALPPVAYWDQRVADEPLQFGSMRDVDILHNRVQGCVQALPDPQTQDPFLGGIILERALQARIHGNTVVGNGRAKRIKAMGVSARFGRGVDVRDNTILDNGTSTRGAPWGTGVDFTTGNHARQAGRVRYEGALEFHLKNFTGDDPTHSDVVAGGSRRGLHVQDAVSVSLPHTVRRIHVLLRATHGPITVAAFERGRSAPVSKTVKQDSKWQWITLRPNAAWGFSIARQQNTKPGFLVGAVRVVFQPLEVQAGIVGLDLESGPLSASSEQWAEQHQTRRKEEQASSLELERAFREGDLSMSDASLGHFRGLPALTVHDNVVSCPRGEALFVRAAGLVTVGQNSLTSFGLVAPRGGSGKSERRARGACVTIQNTSPRQLVEGFDYSGRSHAGYVLMQPATDDTPGGSGPATAPQPEASPNASGSNESKNHMEMSDARKLARGRGDLFPYAGTLHQVVFKGNAVRLRAADGYHSSKAAGILILGEGSVAMEGNEVRCDMAHAPLAVATLVRALSLRVHGNGFLEPPGKAYFSLVALAQHGLVSGNQAMHCIVGDGGDVRLTDNQVFMPGDEDKGECDKRYAAQKKSRGDA